MVNYERKRIGRCDIVPEDPERKIEKLIEALSTKQGL